MLSKLETLQMPIISPPPTMQQNGEKQQSYFYVVWPEEQEKPLNPALESNSLPTTNHQLMSSSASAGLVAVKESEEERELEKEGGNLNNFETNAAGYMDVKNDLMLQKTAQQQKVDLASPTQTDASPVAAASSMNEDQSQTQSATITKQDTAVTVQTPAAVLPGTILLATSGYCMDTNSILLSPSSSHPHDLSTVCTTMGSLFTSPIPASPSQRLLSSQSVVNNATKEALNSTTTSLSALYQSPKLPAHTDLSISTMAVPSPATGTLSRLQQQNGGGSQAGDVHHHHARKQRYPQARHSSSSSSSAVQIQGDSHLQEIGVLAEQAIANLQKISSFTRQQQQYPFKPAATSSTSGATAATNSSQNNGDNTAMATPPPAKRPRTGKHANCLECEVKDAEIAILRRRMLTMEEQMSMVVASVTPQMPVTYQPLSPPPSQAKSPSIPTDYQQLTPLTEPSPGKELLFARRQRRESSQATKREDMLQHQIQSVPMSVQQQPSTSDYVELTADSGVYLPLYKLEEAKREAKTGTQLARKLMDVFWDKDTLARSTLTPKSKFQYQQLDPRTIKAIEAFCLAYDATVHSKDIHATMTDKCCQARSRYRTLQ